jgi:hypothetical protein
MTRSKSKTTADHDEIRRWAEGRGGRPTAVKGTKRGKDDVGMIRIDFPGYSGARSLEPISWDEWFEKFDKSDLAIVLQEKTAKGEQSHFNRLVSRSSLEPTEAGARQNKGKGRSTRSKRSSSGRK